GPATVWNASASARSSISGERSSPRIRAGRAAARGRRGPVPARGRSGRSDRGAARASGRRRGLLRQNVVAADLDGADVRARLPSEDPGAPMSAAFLTWLGDRLGSEPGMVDLVMVSFARTDRGLGLIERDDLDTH